MNNKEMENWNSGTNKPSKQHPESKHEDIKPLMKVKTSGLSAASPALSSPTSSESSPELGKSRKDSLGDANASLSASSSTSDHVPNQTPQWSMISASPRGEDPPQLPDFFPQTSEWSGANPAPMKSPPMHNMGHPPGYDPNRIPLSIFASKPNSSGMEWSTASNESLFSIHMGNSSFNRDQYNMMYRSGELMKPEEWSSSLYNAPEVKSNEKKNLPPNLPPVVEMTKNKEVKNDITLETPKEKIVEPSKIDPGENQENNIKAKKTSDVDEVQHSVSELNKLDEVQHSPSTPKMSDGKVPQFDASHASSPRLSNESGNSSSSFAFPVLLNDSGKTGSLKAPSAKMERPEPPQPQAQPDLQPEMQPQSPQQSRPYSKLESRQPESKQPESQPKLAATTWFSCFSCWPRCC
ncbi:putative pentatricopeptide repeat-containing protein-like [Capsicum annuum]|nr:putative pentatricopeptide repeat-containing protein-like [Capsicum annuum]KAF3657907.1 putative pentatricopeptide repeat-containing protein-like [Capsicum annuum]